MIEIRLAALVVIWFPKYLLRNKSMLDLKILYASGSATCGPCTFYYLLLPYTFLLRIDIFISIAIWVPMKG